MIRNKVSVERQINDRLYQFIIPSESPLSECLLIVDDVRKYIIERIEEVEKQSKEESEKEEEQPE